MTSITRESVLDAVEAGFSAAALGAAMELGLFWLLADRPRRVADLAAELDIPPRRCATWLQLLAGMGLLDSNPEGYGLSPFARAAILDSYSRDTWAFLARETRERMPAVRDLPRHLKEPGSAWSAQGLEPPSYLHRLREDPGRARAFTRMLYEIHRPFAEAIADSLNLDGVNKVMDLGGGSGVVSLALLERHPRLRALVLDLPEVCAAGREIAAERGLDGRIDYVAGDFLADELPQGFDLILECDVNVYSETLLAKVAAALDPGGRFVVVDQLAAEEGVAPPARAMWAFRGTLHDAEYAGPSLPGLKAQLAAAGLGILREERLQLLGASTAPTPSDWILIESGV